MKNPRRWGKPLLWLHLFVCCVWWFLLHATKEPPEWMIHIHIWSVLAIQFTWGFTVGLIVGPSRKNRQSLWWSLLTLFMPLWYLSFISLALLAMLGPVLAAIYVAIFVMILASETYAGVLLGAKMHSQSEE